MNSNNYNVLRVYRNKSQAKEVMTKSVTFTIILPVDLK